ncbi:Pycsar system effector family protein [Streptomyces sp. NPDC001515]
MSGPVPPEPSATPLVPGAAAATRLLSELRAEITRADSKAAVVVAALGMSSGVVCGLLAGGGRPSDQLSKPAATLWWTGVGALAAALLFLLMAVVPRYRASHWVPGAPLTYFGDIRRASRRGQLARALAETDQLPMAALLTALAETSRIAARKHQWIRAGLAAFGLGALLLPASVVIG